MSIIEKTVNILCCPAFVPHISGMDCPVFVVVVRISWQGWALSVSTLLEGALVSNVSKSSRKSQTARNQLEYQDK